MAPSLPSSCPSLVGWETPPLSATRGSPLCSLPNGNSPTAVLWPGSDAACHSLFFARQSSASKQGRASKQLEAVHLNNSFHPLTLFPPKLKFQSQYYIFSLFFFRTLCCLVPSVPVEPVYYIAPTCCNYYYKNKNKKKITAR